VLKKIAEKKNPLPRRTAIWKAIFRNWRNTAGEITSRSQKMYNIEERKDSLMMELVQKKVFDFIEQNANIKVVEKVGLNTEAKS
jgi:trigger factor